MDKGLGSSLDSAQGRLLPESSILSQSPQAWAAGRDIAHCLRDSGKGTDRHSPATASCM